ncbi:MAG: NAD(P)/FAD-dependent oxidoreductase [Thermoplasmatales archaeon]|nr:NAD(P)/FAD-dependent oxidoreductase [Thermoplasmatales archaeon]
MSIRCDVLVVGAGPAGSSAARAAAKKGLKTILIDKKEKIGNPVECAEGIGDFLFPYLPFRIPKEQLIWETNGMFFWTDDISIEKRGDFWKSYSVDRRKFDKWLSELAINEGAELFINTELTDIELDEENNIKKATVKRNGKPLEILPKVVVAADGVESTVLNLLDLYNPKRGDIAEIYSWEMKNLDLYKPTLEQVFTGEFTPSGYAYIFPKGKNSANIGVGGIYPEKKLEKYFEEFLEIPHVKKQVKNAEYVIEKSKKAAFNDLTDKWIYGNVLLAGDTANQNLKPFIEGILPSIICGDIAGKFTCDFCNKKNIDSEKYLNHVKKTMDEHFIFSNELLEGINYLYAKKEKTKYLRFFGMITELFGQADIENTENMDYDELKSKIMRFKDEM